jgi:hypothetical protein
MKYKTNLVFVVETHTSGFNDFFIVDGVDQARLWCLWNVEWKVEITSCFDQFIHLKVAWKGGLTWCLTFVYGSPNYMKCFTLWGSLRELAEDIIMVLGI